MDYRRTRRNARHRGHIPLWAKGADFKVDLERQRGFFHGAEYTSFPRFLASSRADFVRATTGTYEDSLGNLLTFSAGELRCGDRGGLIEPAEDFYNIQSDMSGAAIGVVGTGGGLPYDWANSGFDSVEVVAFGTDADGRSYITLDLLLDRTALGSAYPQIYMIPHFSGTNVPWASGDSVCGTFWHRIDSKGGSDTVSQSLIAVRSYTSETGGTSDQFASNLETSVGLKERAQVSGTCAVAATHKMNFRYQAQVLEGLVLNRRITLWLPAITKSLAQGEPIPTGTRDGSTTQKAADALTLSPNPGTYDITATFDDYSTQVLSGVVIGGEGWVVPTNLNRPYVRSLSGVTV
jgi:hypothetical protein